MIRRFVGLSVLVASLVSFAHAQVVLPEPAILPTASTAEFAARLTQLKSEYVAPRNPTGADSRFSTTLHGLAREIIQYSIIPTGYQTIEVPTPYLDNGRGAAPVQLVVAKDTLVDASGAPYQVTRKAPVVILLNPLFSGAIAAQMSRFIDYFGQRGFHVIAFMNPWSPEILSRAPTFMPGDVSAEGPMHLEMIDRVIDGYIGRANVDGATLVGLSYGAFLSSVVKALDAERANPLINGPTIMMNPPFDMEASLKNVDRQYRESRSSELMCFLNTNIFSVAWQAVFEPDFNKTSMDETCAKYFFMTYGFHMTLVSSLETLNASKGLNLAEAQIQNATYESYMRDISKLNPPAEQKDIGYWLSRAKNKGYERFIVLTSIDDTINEGVDLRNNRYLRFDDSNLLVLPSGGHTGFRSAQSTNKACGADWTTCFMNSIYR